MLDFIIENYYVILIICVLLIFGIIGYMIDSIKNKKYKDNVNNFDAYIPEEEVFIQNNNNDNSKENNEKETNVDELIEDYNKEQNEKDSNNWVFYAR